MQNFMVIQVLSLSLSLSLEYFLPAFSLYCFDMSFLPPVLFPILEIKFDFSSQ